VHCHLKSKTDTEAFLSEKQNNSPALACAKGIVVFSIVFLIALEGLSGYLLRHHSVTYRRVSRQIDEAVRAGPAKPDEPTQVVMIGNSLFLDGVQVDRLQELTSSKLRIYPIFLEATGYHDWLYGLKRIFRRGARPQVVVVQFEPNGLLSNQIRTEYSLSLFFDAADVFHVGSDLGLDRTSKSSLLVAHWSAFGSMHSVIRTQILRHTIPYFRELFFLILPQRSTTTRPDAEEIARARLKTLRDLSAAHGAKLIMLAPPVPSFEKTLGKLVHVAQEIGVTTLVPIDATMLTEQHYESDLLHLNIAGATLFTSALAGVSDRF